MNSELYIKVNNAGINNMQNGGVILDISLY